MLMTHPGSVEWDPLSELRHMQETMNRLFDRGAAPGQGRYPAVNLYARDDGLMVSAEIPGFDPDNLEITVHGDTLRLSGNIDQGDSENVEGWHRRERGRGQFARTIDLPFRADPDSVKARFEDGVLEIEMRRPEEDKPRRITVNG